MRDRYVGALLLPLLVLLAPRGVAAQGRDVIWTDLVNASVNGSVLQKTIGWDGVDDAGAASQQELSAGDGYIEFTVGEADTFWLGGLSRGKSRHGPASSHTVDRRRESQGSTGRGLHAPTSGRRD